MKTGILMSAEEITGVKGCVSFQVDDGAIYSREEGDFAGERLEIFPLNDPRYDYRTFDSDGDRCLVKKEWMKDIREEVDWSKVSVDAKVIVDKVYKMHFCKFEDDKVFYYRNGRTSFTSDGIYSTYPKFCELAEKGE